MDIIRRLSIIFIHSLCWCGLITAAAWGATTNNYDPFARQSSVAAQPILQAKVFTLRYIEAETVAARLGDSGLQLLSAKGRAVIDADNNSLWVYDIAEVHQLVGQLLAGWDQPLQQILLRARIVNADIRFARDLGVDWQLGAGKQRVAVDAGITAPLGLLGLRLGLLPAEIDIDIVLSASVAEQRVEIVAAPSLLVLNRHAARIQQGQRVPYQQETANGGTSLIFEDALLELHVVPRILLDNEMTLDLTIRQDVVSGQRSIKGAPIIDTQELASKIKVRHGETAVLGGILESRKAEYTDKVTTFADLPIIGVLFRREGDDIQRRVLLVFITPLLLDNAA